MAEQTTRKRRRPRRTGKKNFALLNAPLSERLRIHRETDEDLVTQFALELVASIERINELCERLEGIDPGEETLTTPEHLLHLQALSNELAPLSNAAWVQHTQLRDAVHPKSSDTVRQDLRLTWINVCRYAVMVRQVEDMLQGERGFEEWPRELLRTADSFSFVAVMNRYRRNLSLSDRPIGAYSLRTLMVAMGLVSEALDAYGWTPSAGEYVRALFMRYALAVHKPGEHAGDMNDYGQWAASLTLEEGEEATEDDEAEDEDSPFDPLHTQPEPLLSPALVRTSFLDVGERLFFHHLWRGHTLTEFNPPPLLDARWNVKRHHAFAIWRLQHGLPAFKLIMEAMLKDKMLKDSVVGSLQNFLPSRLVWPGEREQMLFEYPQEADGGDPYNILFRLRTDHYKHMQTVLHFEKPLDYVYEYVKQEELLAKYALSLTNPSKSECDWLEVDVTRNRLGTDHERILLLMFEIVFDMRLKVVTEGQVHSVFARHAYVDDRSLEGARARPPFSRRHFVKPDAGWPSFAAVWLNYAVAPNTNDPAAVFTTPHLIDACSAWFTFARQSQHAGQILEGTSFCKGMWRRFEMPSHLLFV